MRGEFADLADIVGLIQALAKIDQNSRSCPRPGAASGDPTIAHGCVRVEVTRVDESVVEKALDHAIGTLE
jgi:hypothetical protein